MMQRVLLTVISIAFLLSGLVGCGKQEPMPAVSSTPANYVEQPSETASSASDSTAPSGSQE